METAQPHSSPAQRLDSVDLLRGLVMVIMALDHVRDFFHHDAVVFDPTDLSKTNVLLFFTRWITHFCAPIFVFLAGTGVFLSLSRGRSKAWMSRFLITRGLWLIVLEFTVVRFGWTFDLNYAQFTVVQVIWVIGVSMIVLAGLIHLSVRTTAVIGIAMIALHNSLDGITVQSAGNFGSLWTFLHVQGLAPIAGSFRIFVIYPLIPWIGVMAAGYGFGSLLLQEPAARKRSLLRLGFGLIAAFVIIRGINIYGDLRPWSGQNSFVFTVLSFINTKKYPPSLDYILMTIGPAVLFLAFVEQWKGKLAGVIIVYGRVPMFYYILHIPLIHLLAGIASYAQYGAAAFHFSPLNLPPDYGFNLFVVYAVWIGTVALLYPACRWYSEVKKKSRNPLLSYL